MMDYSKLSDFEINKLVAIATGRKQFSSLGWQGLQEGNFSAVIVRGPRKIGGFDPCNDPADAWPIIDENNITIINDNPSLRFAVSEVAAYFNGSNHIWSAHENGLRAAMIVFLKMQDSRQSPY
ncbi:phage protein NinX family protein [Klebsiella pneumoniae]|uniref:phage protein NinX family protein n=1 Tax=Klebsiella pneumoniae TaxID=573 RepID=UPI001CBF7EAD|nr:phage protein NinX family protein [Klebsiella pneumoniae]MCH9348863.1 DUF2591 family protein [Klebsiella pneumoniae]MCH9439049.1 DUF2591 family protein [Klebsiella pneumoniae]MCH9465532.1 DUF2591 family protein [Klebsiella pneumoniae]MCH9471051.1 DUF2591 family protein [Klebsiella pneumoniae]MCH9476794.1 DUF2591 family protein [Klebsiella pneumoniae]